MVGAGLLGCSEELAGVAAAAAVEEPDAGGAFSDERHVDVLVAFPDVGELAAEAVDLVECGSCSIRTCVPGGRSRRVSRARLVAVALVALLGRVDLDEPHAPAVDELDRVAVDHARDDGALRRAVAGEQDERAEREGCDDEEQRAASPTRAEQVADDRARGEELRPGRDAAGRCQPWMRWLGKSLRPPGRGRRRTCSMSGAEAASAPIVTGLSGP